MSDELAKALRALQKAADVVQQKGACTGSEWVRLSAAQLSASAALTAYEAQAKAPGHTDLMVAPESIDAFLDANPPPSDAEKTLAELDAKLIESLDDLMRGAENYFSTENPKRKGQIAASAKRINAQIVTPLRSHIASLVKERDEARAEAARMREALKELLETAVEPDTDSELYHCNLKRKAARAALNPETPDAKG